MCVGTLKDAECENKGGVIFIKLLKNSFGHFMNQIDSSEQYFMGKSVLGIEYASRNILVAALYIDSAFHVIDRSQK
jgi:hypothetical protein